VHAHHFSKAGTRSYSRHRRHTTTFLVLFALGWSFAWLSSFPAGQGAHSLTERAVGGGRQFMTLAAARELIAGTDHFKSIILDCGSAGNRDPSYRKTDSIVGEWSAQDGLNNRFGVFLASLSERDGMGYRR